MWTLLQIAARNLAQHRRRTLLLGGAIAGVTGLLVILLGLSTGIRETMLRTATTLLTGHINVAGFYKVTAGQSAPVVTDYRAVLEIVRRETPELTYLVERGRGYGKIISDTASMQGGISGLDIQGETGLREVLQIADGRLDDLSQPGTVLLFEDQAKRLEVKVGDTLTISTSTPRGVANTLDVRIVAIARDVGLLSRFYVYIPMVSLRNLYQLNDNATGALMLYLKDLQALPAVQERLRAKLTEAGYRLLDPSPQPFFQKFQTVNREDWTGQKLDITTWEDETSFMSWTLQTLEGLTFTLISILLVIIVIGIMNTMWIAIRERTREIGTLRAIGMQRSRVMIMFLIEALLLGLTGTAVGALGGLGVSALLNGLGIEVPVAVQLFLMSDKLFLSVHGATVLLSVIAISLVTTLAALYPAYRAARLKPITAMHHIG